MIEIADEDPKNVAFLDIYDEFAAIGIPGSDQFGIRDADLAHLLADGHALFAQFVKDWLGFLLPARFTAPAPDPVVTLTTLTSATFTGTDGTIFGRSTDALLGGTAKAWETSTTTSTSLVVSSGVLRIGADTFSRFDGVAVPTPLISRRATLATSSEIYSRIGTDSTVSVLMGTELTARFPIVVGDVVAIHSSGTAHSLYVME